jgi:hypothetical protein
LYSWDESSAEDEGEEDEEAEEDWAGKEGNVLDVTSGGAALKLPRCRYLHWEPRLQRPDSQLGHSDCWLCRREGEEDGDEGDGDTERSLPCEGSKCSADMEDGKNMMQTVKGQRGGRTREEGRGASNNSCSGEGQPAAARSTRRRRQQYHNRSSLEGL